MPVKCVVLDFDGTFTDVIEEAKPFVPAYKNDLRDLLSIEIEEFWQEACEEINANPSQYGWKHNGKIVAPALSDPYIHTTAAAQIVFDKRQVLQDLSFRSALVQVIYRRSYEKTQTCFRPHAVEVLEALLAKNLPVFIVTNSDTEAVTKKIHSLDASLIKHVEIHGNAKKFLLMKPSSSFAAFEALPETKILPGQEDRPVFLRRGFYYEVLHGLWQKTGTSPKDTLVCGDIYDLDLALPEALGSKVHIMTRDNTPAAEKNWMTSLGERGGFSDDLRSILTRLE